MQELEYKGTDMQQLPGIHPYISRFSIHATVPPATDLHTVLQRIDEVSTVLRMLGEPQTSAVILGGVSGVGKSTLAALLYHHLQGAINGVPTDGGGGTASGGRAISLGPMI